MHHLRNRKVDGLRFAGQGFLFRILCACLATAGAFLCSIPLRAQTNPLPAPHPRPSLLSPEANNPPDANDQMMMRQREKKEQNFDALNALRQQQIVSDAAKLLILTNDLKAKMQKLGNKPFPPIMVREAEVIEVLAHDVQTKMSLTVGGG